MPYSFAGKHMTNTPKSSNDFANITAILQGYFEGLYHADIDQLISIFHPDTQLIAPGNRRSVNKWLIDVTNREVPAQLNHPFSFEILAIDIVQDQAMAKVKCPLFDCNYIDFLGLLKEDGQWRIISKMYTDIKEKTA